MQHYLYEIVHEQCLLLTHFPICLQTNYYLLSIFLIAQFVLPTCQPISQHEQFLVPMSIYHPRPTQQLFHAQKKRETENKILNLLSNKRKSITFAMFNFETPFVLLWFAITVIVCIRCIVVIIIIVIVACAIRSFTVFVVINKWRLNDDYFFKKTNFSLVMVFIVGIWYCCCHISCCTTTRVRTKRQNNKYKF